MDEVLDDVEPGEVESVVVEPVVGWFADGARAQVDTHCQNGSSAWPLSRYVSTSRPIRPPRDDTARFFFVKNRVSMSMYPSPPRASDDVPSSIQSFGPRSPSPAAGTAAVERTR